MNNWKDNTSYSRGERGTAKPRVLELDLGGLRVCVHRLHGIEGVWFVSCHAMGIDQHQLNSTDVEKAKREAIGYAFDRSKRWNEKLLAALGKEMP